MRSLKTEIFLTLLFITIGIAAVTTNVIINVTTSINQNPDDFLVYFSDVAVDGEQDLSLVENEHKLVFSSEFTAVGDKKVISYDITNASKNYDADVLISCTESNTYLTITNVFDMKSSLSARSTRTGTLTVELKNAVSEEISQEVTCTITADAVERETQGSGDISIPLHRQYDIGDVVSIAEEKFNIISIEDGMVSMLAIHNLGSNYRQTTTKNTVTFSTEKGWSSQEIDLQLYDGNAQKYVNEYSSFLKNELNITNLETTFITLNELKELGCSINDDYSISDSLSCVDSEYYEWLINGQKWWTRSKLSADLNNIWSVEANGDLSYTNYFYPAGIRPVIILPADVAGAYVVNNYEIGEEIAIGDEMFNVISDNGTNVTMLAQKNISEAEPYKQTDVQGVAMYSGGRDWITVPGVIEVDLQLWGRDVETILNGYLSYLNTEFGVSATGDFITLSKLNNLGCNVPADYLYGDGGWTCATSPYSEWLVNGQAWWTKSAWIEEPDYLYLWGVDDDGGSDDKCYGDSRGVRPVITVSKNYLK